MPGPVSRQPGRTANRERSGTIEKEILAARIAEQTIADAKVAGKPLAKGSRRFIAFPFHRMNSGEERNSVLVAWPGMRM